MTAPAASARPVRATKTITGDQLDAGRGRRLARARVPADRPDGHRDAERLPRARRPGHDLPVPVAAQRHRDRRADAATLNLATAGNGDRGDTIRVEVAASDPERRPERLRRHERDRRQHRAAGRHRDRQARAAVDRRRRVRGRRGLRGRRRRRAELPATSGSATAPRSPTRRAARSTSPSRATATSTTPSRSTSPRSTAPAARARPCAARPRSPARDTHPVASFGFEEAAGNSPSTTRPAPTATISGAARSNNGRFGRALSFDGTDDIVTVPDDPTIDLTSGMTLEAWVQPVGRDRLADGDLQGVERRPQLRAVRQHRRRQPGRARVRRRRRRHQRHPGPRTRTNGRTSPRPSTATCCACSSTACR